MAIEFNMVITREGLDFAREASANANWHLIPKRYAISATAGELSETRDYTSMLSTWTSSAMTSLLNGTNKIQTNVVINASASGIDRQIGEIYFIFTNESHEEFLFAIAQPSTRLMFTPGVQQNYIFVWTLNNANVQDIVEINYSFAEDIDAHNNDPDAHSYLLARDGSRTATNILRYATNLTFTNNLDIVNKRYVDNQVSTGTNSHNANTSAHSYLLARDGSRTATGILRYDSNKSFTNNLDIVNKYYVDTRINTVRDTLENQIDTVKDDLEDQIDAVKDDLTIYDRMFPNYKNLRTREKDTSYTENTPGWIVYDVQTDNNDLTLTLGSLTLILNGEYQRSSIRQSGVFPVRKGVTWKITGRGVVHKLYFSPIEV